MKKFLFKLLLIGSLLILQFAFILVLPPGKTIQKSGFFAQLDKNKLLKNTPAPRLILIGGSNLSFGIDSKVIKDSLSLNPINTGLNFFLGLKYMLKNTVAYIRENDIVVISPEYEHFYGNFADGDIDLLTTITDVSPKTISLLDFHQILKLIQFIPLYSRSKMNGWFGSTDKFTNTGIYDRDSFNSFGDAFKHWTLPKENVPPAIAFKGHLNESIFTSLIEFGNEINRKKAKLYITFPGMQEESFQNTKNQIHEIENKLMECKFDLLSTPERYVIKDSLIFNTYYHLTKKGVDYRTSLLIDDLKRVLNKNRIVNK